MPRWNTISCTVPRILQMKAILLPKRNTSIPDVPENRKQCLLTPSPPRPSKRTRQWAKHSGASLQQAQPWALSLSFHRRLRGVCLLWHAVSWGMGHEVLYSSSVWWSDCVQEMLEQMGGGRGSSADSSITLWKIMSPGQVPADGGGSSDWHLDRS